MVRLISLFIILLLLTLSLSAQDIDYGYVRLNLNRKDGSFSLSYLLDPVRMVYEPVFYNKNPATTFITVVYDGKFYRLGQSKEFEARIATNNGNPALVFESDFMALIETFSPVITPSSDKVNGVKITYDVLNKRGGASFIGLRLLFDTHLGEARKDIPFITNRRLITKEKIINQSDGEYFWLSRGKNISIMGSIKDPVDPDAITPSFLHIANWKRLNSVLWDLAYEENRSFHNMPYSVRDSAICYYYDPLLVASGESFSFSIYITTEDMAWFNPEHPLSSVAQGRGAVPPAPVTVAPVTPVAPPPVPEASLTVIKEEPVVIVEIEEADEAAPIEIVEIEDNIEPVTIVEIEEVDEVVEIIEEIKEIEKTIIAKIQEEAEIKELDIKNEYISVIEEIDSRKEEDQSIKEYDAELDFIAEINETVEMLTDDSARIAETANSINELLELQYTLQRFLSGDISLNENELLYIESSINRLKSGL